VSRAVRRPGGPLQRPRVQPRDAAHDRLRRQRCGGALVHYHLRARQSAGSARAGTLFDSVGASRCSATYLGSEAVAVVLGIVFTSHALTSASFIAIVVVVFFLASVGARAAYLTASEIFPMDGDPHARDRVLLCDRHRRRGNHRPAAVRASDRDRREGDRSRAGSSSAPRYWHSAASPSCSSASRPLGSSSRTSPSR
jgi:hypothetical protein